LKHLVWDGHVADHAAQECMEPGSLKARPPRPVDRRCCVPGTLRGLKRYIGVEESVGAWTRSRPETDYERQVES
jgi:hypothetical protein